MYVGYYCQIQTYDGKKEKFSRLAKTIKTWIDKERPLCYKCEYVHYISTPKSFKVVKVVRNVTEFELYPKLISRDNIFKFIDYAKSTDTNDMKQIILGTEFNDDYAYRIRSELNRLHLLKSFKPDIPICDIDFESVETWKAYNYSDNCRFS